MFNLLKKLFSSSSDTISYKTMDKIWINKAAMYEGLLQDLEKSSTIYPEIYIVTYFDYTLQEATALFESQLSPALQQKIKLISAQQLISQRGATSNSLVIFLEHFPIYSIEADFLQKIQEQTLTQTHILFYLDIDNPLITYFGGERIKKLMIQLGIQTDEMLENTMITKSLLNAQKKLEKRLAKDSLKPAKSLANWFEINVKP